MLGLLELSLQVLNSFNPARYGALSFGRFCLKRFYLENGAVLIFNRSKWCTSAHFGWTWTCEAYVSWCSSIWMYEADIALATPTTTSSSLPDYFVTDDGHFAGMNH
jgi:hypothetical protein